MEGTKITILNGKIAVVTGAGSGIGRGICLALANQGVTVVASDIRSDAAEKTRDEIIACGNRAISIATDVSDAASVRALADAAFSKFGSVDILINNAGVAWRPLRSFLEATTADWDWHMSVNFHGVINGMHAFVPRMKDQPGDKFIVNTSSITALLPVAGHALQRGNQRESAATIRMRMSAA